MIVTDVVALVRTRCCACNMVFAIPELVEKSLRNTGRQFYCPLGHSLTYGKTRINELEQQIQRERARADQAEAKASRQQEVTEYERRRAAAARGQLTKVKNRVGHGVCPCCNRTFGNLQRHMISKHPDYLNEEAET